jgi:iron complex outermembrane receptor protein
MPDAPESFANIRLNYRSDLLNGGYVEVEWVREGEHWLDEKNDNDDRTDDMDKYPGHNLLNLRVEYHLKTTVSLYARVF